MNFEYFERNTPNTIEKLLIEHGDDVCSNMIGIDYLRDQLTRYDFGFIRRTQNTIYSFVLCKLNTEFSDIGILLVCPRPKPNDRTVIFLRDATEYAEVSSTNVSDIPFMLGLVHEKARQIDVASMSLIAVGNIRILNWYKNHGFYMQSYAQEKDKQRSRYILCEKRCRRS